MSPVFLALHSHLRLPTALLSTVSDMTSIAVTAGPAKVAPHSTKMYALPITAKPTPICNLHHPCASLAMMATNSTKTLCVFLKTAKLTILTSLAAPANLDLHFPPTAFAHPLHVLQVSSSKISSASLPTARPTPKPMEAAQFACQVSSKKADHAWPKAALNTTTPINASNAPQVSP